MYESIKNFNKQFLYVPEIENEGNLVKKKSFLSVGMGGSNLAPRILKTWDSSLDITVQNDYGLQGFSKEQLKDKLIILSSYSGNTEEAIDAFKQAKGEGLEIVVISAGGELLKLAIDNKVAYIQLPDTGVQPRMALGLSVMAFLKILGREDEIKNIASLSETLEPTDFEKKGKEIALRIKNYVPVIYTSTRNLSLAYNWKIKLNETGKTPAFYNVFPELNHNEMTGFDVVDTTKGLSEKFYFLILKDREDDPRIMKRIEVLEKLYKERGLLVETVELNGKNTWYKIFSILILADWIAYYTALGYGVESEQVPMVEEFKKLILK